MIYERENPSIQTENPKLSNDEMTEALAPVANLFESLVIFLFVLVWWFSAAPPAASGGLSRVARVDIRALDLAGSGV